MNFTQEGENLPAFQKHSCATTKKDEQTNCHSDQISAPFEQTVPVLYLSLKGRQRSQSQSGNTHLGMAVF